MTQITNTINKPHSAYCLLALLSNDAKEQLSDLLDSLQKKLGKSIYVMPKENLHITLCEIIQSKEYSENKELLYSKNSSEYEELSEEVFAQFKPIHIVFDKIEVSPQAIIIRGKDDGSFETIRKGLVENLPLPTETKRPPEIIHCTIARFLTEMPIEEVRDIVEKDPFTLNEKVGSFSLIHSTVSPLIAYDIIRKYDLKD